MTHLVHSHDRNDQARVTQQSEGLIEAVGPPWPDGEPSLSQPRDHQARRRTSSQSNVEPVPEPPLANRMMRA